MATTIVQGGAVVSSDVPIVKELGGIERYIVRRAHPVSIYFELVGLIWFLFYFWNHLWVEAVLVYTICRVVGSLAVSRANVRLLAQTLLGRMALLHLSGSNFFLQIAGMVVSLFGVWSHDVRGILLGVSLLLLGHVQGWGKVDPRLDTR